MVWILYILIGLSSMIAQKNASNVVKVDAKKASSQIYLIITAFFACFFFFVTGGFRLKINMISFCFSVLFSIICILANILNLSVYKYFDIAQVTVINGIGSILLTTFLGLCVFNEKLTKTIAIKCILMIIAVIFSFLSNKKRKTGNIKKICFLLFMPVISALVWLVLKLYSKNPNAVSNSSFCFFTNTIMLAFSFVWLFVKIKKGNNYVNIKNLNFGRRELLATAFNVVSANGMQLVEMFLISKIDMVLITPITTALSFMIGAVSSLIYKEKLNICSIITILISIAVTFII